MRSDQPTFITCCYHGDWHLCVRLMAQLVLYHKRAKRIIITDGKVAESQKKILMGSCHHFIEGDSLGRDWDRPTAWLKRLLSVGLEHMTGDILVKVDPDAYFKREIRSYPDFDLFGSGGQTSVQGGIYGIRRQAIEKILDREILDLPELQLCNGYSQLGAWEDEQISRSVQHAGGTIGRWMEVNSRFKPDFRRPEMQPYHAVWHPIKEM